MEDPRRDGLNLSDLPLSLSQREIWLDQCAWQGSTHLNIGGYGFIRGPFTREVFAAALTDLVAECEALRLVPNLHGRQRCLASWPAQLMNVAVGRCDHPESFLKDWVAQQIKESFVLGETPPWRFTLLHFSSTLHALSIQFHHLVMDGWGTVQVMRRWVELYHARMTGRAAPPGVSGILCKRGWVKGWSSVLQTG